MNKSALLFLLTSVPAFALPLERADPSALGPEDSILSIARPPQFVVDEQLKKNVAFWVDVYSRYTTQQGLIHDAKYIDHIYEVIDLDASAKNSTRRVKATKKKWKEILLSVHRKQNKPEQMTEMEKKVFDLFSDVKEQNKFLNAAHRKRLRFQLGQRDRFLEGLYASGRYLPKMEEIFKKEGLPLELTRLPFVESSFNVKARSKVGASGIWQFMRSTARFFVKTNQAVDERNDPILATEAAAQLLKLNYDSLRSWPLAVTAYNHGRKGMMRAVRRVGSEELEKVISDYHSRSFGFASSNFFTELLGAIEVERNAEKYFGKQDRAKPVAYIEATLPHFMEIQELVKGTQLDLSKLKELNPGLSDAVFSGRLLVPSGYRLRIPVMTGTQEDTLARFWSFYAEIPESYKLRTQRALKYGTRSRTVKNRLKNRTSLPSPWLLSAQSIR